MRTKLRGKMSLLFVLFAVLLAIPALAVADVLKNAVTNETGIGGIRNYTAGDAATSVDYWIDKTGTDCDAADGSSATVTLSVSSFPSGSSANAVTISPSSQTFTACGTASTNTKAFSFSTAANAVPGDYRIAASVLDTSGTYNTNPAEFRLRVSSPTAANQAPTADAGGPYTVDEGGSVKVDASGSTDPDGSIASYAWDFDADGLYDDATGVSPNFSAADLDGPSSHTIAVKVTDDKGASATDAATVNVLNVPPKITNLTASAQNALTGKNVTFTGTATDPSSADTQAGFFWQWSKDGGAYTPTSLPNPFAAGGNPFTTSFTTCGEHTVSAKTADKDDGVSAPKALSDPISVYNASFSPPVDVAPYLNTVQKGRVIPVKISVSCNGNITGLTPSIQLLSGDKTDGSETTQDEIETYSVSSADTTGVMRAVDGGYIYNLQVPSQANAYYTVRVNPFGGSNASSNMYALLKTR